MKQKLSFKYYFFGIPHIKNYEIEARFISKMKNKKGEKVDFKDGFSELWKNREKEF